MKAIIISIIIILCFNNNTFANCEEKVKLKLDNQEAYGFNIAVYIEDRDLSIATFELWEVTQRDINVTIDNKCNNKSLSLCHQIIDNKISKYEKHGITLSYEDRSEIYWRCEK